MVKKGVFFRLLSDLPSIALLLGRAHRLIIAFLIFWSLVFHFASISYHAQYDRAISIFTIIGQLGEGTQVMSAAYALTRSWTGATKTDSLSKVSGSVGGGSGLSFEGGRGYMVER